MFTKATRSDGGYVFHGGCHNCTTPFHKCAECCYMEPNWKLPDLNSNNTKAEVDPCVSAKSERDQMRELAYAINKIINR